MQPSATELLAIGAHFTPLLFLPCAHTHAQLLWPSSKGVGSSCILELYFLFPSWLCAFAAYAVPRQLRALAHELLTAVLDTFPLVGSVSSNLAFFDQLHRAFREDKWRSFGKGVARAIASMHTLADKVYGPGTCVQHAHRLPIGEDAPSECALSWTSPSRCNSAQAIAPKTLHYVVGLLERSCRL